MTRKFPLLAVLALAVFSVGSLTACTGSSTAHSTGPSCLLPASPAPGASGAGSPAPGAVAMPDISLPCLDGGATVHLATLGRPAVINLWASWCTPCRAELPAIQQFAAQQLAAAHGVTVLGVDTADTTRAASSTIEDKALTYPMLADPSKSLLNALGRSMLPATLFVDANGGLRYVYNEGTPLTPQRLAELTATYLSPR